MREKSAPKKHAQLSMIYLTFLLLLSIPLTIFGLTQDDFDLRERAFDDLELSEEHPCLISFPNVNPYSLQVGETVMVQVDSKLKDTGISGLRVSDGEGNLVHQESFTGSPIEIATSFPYTPQKAGEADLIGELTLTEGGRVSCEITSPYDIQGLQIIPENNAPDFITLPSQSIPSQNIVTNDTYEYTLEAQDPDGDRINYSYSFTPRAHWLNKTIIDDGSSGRLTIKFSGRADKPASYLANIFIHDGYSKNLRAQSWVINVSPRENDIPVVTITEPTESLRLDKGTTFKSSWKATDRNFIEKYELFITKNITDEEQWIPIDENIPYDTNSYNVETSGLTTGTYKLIAQAVDNQTPPSIGRGISPEIVISAAGETPTEKPDDKTADEVILSDPQVINMSPMSTDEITNTRVTIKATLVAGTDATINEESIMFKLDNVDLSEQIKINRISDKEYTIIYQPQQDLDAGLHKAEVIFEDSRGSDINKSWNFTIQALETDDDSTYNIFGYEIGKNVIQVVAIGAIAVILAIVAPFIIFSIWKGDKTKDDSAMYTNSKLPPSIPTDDTEYTPIEKDFGVKEMVQTDAEPAESPEEDLWDKYSAPKPQERDSSIEKEEIEVKVEETPETPKQEELTTPPPPPPPPSEIPAQMEEVSPTIPEPEIPEISELQKLSEQLQKIREQEKEENNNNQPPKE
ncbi:MAG: seg [candidate division WS6 bacterium 36_33]|uniref:Seg n=1 Tax=candidate division WS6 bacterium 36_33 TaxID=1641388 RepID=A0A101H043_9BACT|nr:MAG: seg [candidate division WS6 bacterium 36_33]